MVQIVGKYEHENSEGFEEYLAAVGTPEDAAKVMGESKPVIEIKESGGQWTVSVTNAGKVATSTFKLGAPYDETMPNGHVLKSVTVREGDKFITTTDLPEGNKSNRTYEFTDNGIVLHLSDNKSGKKAKRVYKRV